MRVRTISWLASKSVRMVRSTRCERRLRVPIGRPALPAPKRPSVLRPEWGSVVSDMGWVPWFDILHSVSGELQCVNTPYAALSKCVSLFGGIARHVRQQPVPLHLTDIGTTSGGQKGWLKSLHPSKPKLWPGLGNDGLLTGATPSSN